MAVELTDVFRAASLIQWGLQPRMRPLQNAEYRELVREYMNRSEFRDVVAEMSDGLGLYVLNVSEHGIVLTPREGSVFWMRPSELRTGSSATTDRRLLDGIVQVTIAATVFPRARDLEDDVNRPRPPVTVDEIDDTLRAICASLKKEFANADPDMDDVRTGIYDAWRVYDSTLAVRETKDGREASSTSTRIIKYNLEKLKEYGCFSETRYAGKDAWQPTRRYNVLVQDLAASRIYDEIMRIQAKFAADGGVDAMESRGDRAEGERSFDDFSLVNENDIRELDGFDEKYSKMARIAGAGKTSERPRVDEHGIEYADDYFDESEGDSRIAGDGKTPERPRVDEHGIEYADDYFDDESEGNSRVAGDGKTPERPRVDEHGIEYADDYFDDESEGDSRVAGDGKNRKNSRFGRLDVERRRKRGM